MIGAVGLCLREGRGGGVTLTCNNVVSACLCYVSNILEFHFIDLVAPAVATSRARVSIPCRLHQFEMRSDIVPVHNT